VAPQCHTCGAPRRFEFQVLPQLLSALGVDATLSSPDSSGAALDFGTIAVYTCTASCSAGGAGGAPYTEEWAWVQPTQDDKTTAKAGQVPPQISPS
jgi:hypothetical protein